MLAEEGAHGGLEILCCRRALCSLCVRNTATIGKEENLLSVEEVERIKRLYEDANKESQENVSRHFT